MKVCSHGCRHKAPLASQAEGGKIPRSFYLEGRGPPTPSLGAGEGGSSRREGLVGAHHAWLAWPWASQAIMRERFRAPVVLATCVP